MTSRARIAFAALVFDNEENAITRQTIYEILATPAALESLYEYAKGKTGGLRLCVCARMSFSSMKDQDAMNCPVIPSRPDAPSSAGALR